MLRLSVLSCVMDDRIVAEISLLRSSVLPDEFAWAATVSDETRRHWEVRKRLSPGVTVAQTC